MDFNEMLTDSSQYTKNALWGSWIKWAILALYTPINLGYYMCILRGERPAPQRIVDVEQTFMNGLKLFIVLLIYSVPVLIIAAIFLGGSYALLSSVILTGNSSAAIAIIGTMMIGSLITFLLSILVGLIAAVAAVRFSRTEDYSEAFNFGAVLNHIAKIGWGTYTVSLILPLLIIGIICLGLLFVPIIGWCLLLILIPVFGVFLSRYITLIYDSASPEGPGPSPASAPAGGPV